MAIFNAVPNNLTNGTTADATQVMANFNQIISNGNANAAANGVNNDITQLAAVTTPLTPAQGGTGVATGTTSPTTWTPTDASGAGLAATWTVTDAHFYQVGKLIFIGLDITFPVTASGAALKIGGLPTAAFNAAFFAGAIYQLGGAADMQNVVVNANATTFQVWDNSTGAFITNANKSATTWRASFAYFTG